MKNVELLRKIATFSWKTADFSRKIARFPKKMTHFHEKSTRFLVYNGKLYLSSMFTEETATSRCQHQNGYFYAFKCKINQADDQAENVKFHLIRDKLRLYRHYLTVNCVNVNIQYVYVLNIYLLESNMFLPKLPEFNIPQLPLEAKKSLYLQKCKWTKKESLWKSSKRLLSAFFLSQFFIPPLP